MVDKTDSDGAERARAGQRCLAWLARHNPSTLSRWVAVWLALGLVCGLFASAYWLLLESLTRLLARPTGGWVVLVMTTAGLVIALVVHRLGDPGEIATIVDNIHVGGGRLEMRRNPAMLLASLASISAGGSLGPEAPLVQVTGSVGTWLADRLLLQGGQLRALSLAGMAAGFTALFGAPLGGALFALEILHHRRTVAYEDALLPALVSSCGSYLVFAWLTHLGYGPTWRFPSFTPQSPADFLQAVGCGLAGAAAGWLFMALFRALGAGFKRLPGPAWVRPALAGLVLGALAWRWPLARYFGHEQLGEAIAAAPVVSALLGLAAVKLVAIAITATGGWRGGFIIPLFFAGACLGRALAAVWPGLSPGLAMVCAMAGLNVAVTRTPVSTTLLLAKLTGSPVQVILFAALSGSFLAPKDPLIESQLGSGAPDYQI